MSLACLSNQKQFAYYLLTEIAGWLVKNRKSFTPSSVSLRGARITSVAVLGRLTWSRFPSRATLLLDGRRERLPGQSVPAFPWIPEEPSALRC